VPIVIALHCTPKTLPAWHHFYDTAADVGS
jgi:hypothetical protein